MSLNNAVSLRTGILSIDFMSEFLSEIEFDEVSLFEIFIFFQIGKSTVFLIL